jgi:hypothetical protein
VVADLGAVLVVVVVLVAEYPEAVVQAPIVAEYPETVVTIQRVVLF